MAVHPMTLNNENVIKILLCSVVSKRFDLLVIFYGFLVWEKPAR